MMIKLAREAGLWKIGKAPEYDACDDRCCTGTPIYPATVERPIEHKVDENFSPFANTTRSWNTLRITTWSATTGMITDEGESLPGGAPAMVSPLPGSHRTHRGGVDMIRMALVMVGEPEETVAQRRRRRTGK